ncbi:MAG: ABC transporter ATP-binding protein [Hungatella sp.]|jgi:energy-coupling factor transport system ATP-binding protein|nr:ABC transporter ATP-binding protein [Hungatella sp.]
MKEPIISFRDFTFKYLSQAEPTLKNINLDIYEGEKVLVIGPSGSGKSTIIKCINGLIPNKEEGTLTGEVLIKGKSLPGYSLFDLSFLTGTVLQDTDSQFIGLTVGEDIAFSLENDNVAQQEMKDRVRHWAKEVNIDNFLSSRPQDLSGGQKQRATMAGILIDESPVLLFDEPLAALDPQSGQEAIEIIDAIHKKGGSTVIIVEHRLEDVLYRPVDRIVVFYDGEIIANMAEEELLKSDILKKHGLREPLYITAMKYAGVDIKSMERVRMDRAALDGNIAGRLEKFAESVEKKPEENQYEASLVLENINFSYNKEKINLDNISLSFRKGEMISIVGENGAGKTTLAKAICKFITPDSGRILLESNDISSDSIKERADKVGFVMQNPNQMISKKMIFDEVALGLRLRGADEDTIEQKVNRVLQVCGLYSFRKWPIAALSYGQKKRVTIASILVLEPDFLILDEPTAGQDYKNYSDIMAFLEELNAMGKTIIMITHDMHLMIEYTDRTIVMANSKVIADTDPISVLTDRDLIKKASLKETSLFTLGEKMNLKNPVEFVRKFISYDRRMRSDRQ